MNQFTVHDLTRILRSCGDSGAVDALGEADLDTPVAELGLDSLAMLEVAGVVQREYGVPMPDEALEHMTTARSTVAYVNARLTEAGVA
ncbi:acyl carrier protein [Micromonospora soli]|uniref:acyl carrier protein n=1 Tax=Micromonospora sp. NBRC 110009 TaxID=3061627 RepID=UPI00267295B6|nr:acyl carrier protein [Micromonospora sp. NBRC 110009]WKU00454.1 acyl carrier protein [Micromonospora sp. NBRC 110009]